MLKSLLLLLVAFALVLFQGYSQQATSPKIEQMQILSNLIGESQRQKNIVQMLKQESESLKQDLKSALEAGTISKESIQSLQVKLRNTELKLMDSEKKLQDIERNLSESRGLLDQVSSQLKAALIELEQLRADLTSLKQALIESSNLSESLKKLLAIAEAEKTTWIIIATVGTVGGLIIGLLIK